MLWDVLAGQNDVNHDWYPVFQPFTWGRYPIWVKTESIDCFIVELLQSMINFPAVSIEQSHHHHQFHHPAHLEFSLASERC